MRVRTRFNYGAVLKTYTLASGLAVTAAHRSRTAARLSSSTAVVGSTGPAVALERAGGSTVPAGSTLGTRPYASQRHHKVDGGFNVESALPSSRCRLDARSIADAAVLNDLPTQFSSDGGKGLDANADICSHVNEGMVGKEGGRMLAPGRQDDSPQ